MRFCALAIFIVAAAHAAIQPPAEPVSARERALGYSERVVLAKPRAEHLATIEAAEGRERIRVRETFARLGGVRVVELDDGESVEETIARLQATGRYEYVEPDRLMWSHATPTDARFSSQWSLNNTGQLAGSTPGADIRAVQAWDTLSRAPGVVVAIVDSGINAQHEDIGANLWQNPAPTIGDVNGIRIVRGIRSGTVADDVGHGSHVAGIVGAVGNNGLGIAGIAWEVQLMILKNGEAAGSFISDSVACVDYAVANGAKVINCSFGGTNFSQTFFNALQAARDAGVIVVAAAGNAGTNNDLAPVYPANYLLDNIVSVGNTGPADLPSSTSDFGAAVELFAPGTSILSLTNLDNTSCVLRSGTSMAAPHVTGAFALLRARFPNDTYRQLINRLLRSTDVKSSLVNRAQTAGRLNLQRALTSTTNRPFNDDFEGRAIVSGATLALRSNNRDATLEAGEPSHPNADASRTLWWEWSPGTTSAVSLSTLGSDYDTTLAVYTGNSLNGLTLIAANDNDGSRLTSRVTFEARTGISYRVSIGGKNDGSGYTQFNVGLAPTNDAFAQATPLSGESARATTRIDGASVEPGEPGILGQPGAGSLWYRWVAPRSGRFQVSAFSTAFDTLLAVYKGPNLSQLTLVDANDDGGIAPVVNTDSRCTIEATAGAIYHIQVDRKAGGDIGEVIVTLVDTVWQFSGDTTVTSSPSVAPDGTIYFGTLSPDRRFYAVTPDGTLKWSYNAGGGIDVGSPAIGSNGTIYIGTSDGRLTALTPGGAVQWQRNFSPSTLAAVTPAIAADGTIYTHLNDGYLYALNPADGSNKWRLNLNTGATYTSATIAPDGTIYQASNDRSLYAVTPDGIVKWKFDLASDVFSSPALDAAGNVYIATSTGGRVFSITPTGSQRWSVSGPTLTTGSPTLSADGATLYVGGGPDRRLYAFSTTNGATRWTYTMGDGVVASAPAIDSEGVIYIGSVDAKLYAVSATGVLKRVFDASQSVNSSPVIVGGMLYFTSRDGKLYAVNLNATAASGPWTQYAQNPLRNGRSATPAIALATVPQSRIVATGQPAVLSASATGAGPFSYQWFKDGQPVPGATSATYTIGSAGPNHQGNYAVRISGGGSALTSPAASLTVENGNPGRLVNLSILTELSPTTSSFTMGYVVGGGTGAKPMLVRAAGPSLASVGVAGFADDPRMELFAGAIKTTENDNWGGSSALTTAFASVGAFPFISPTSRDSASMTTLTTRDNSVKISSANGGSGTVLAELYDAAPGAGNVPGGLRLLNVSVLKHVDSTITLGFVIGGGTAKTVLIRAIGPTLGLAPFNVGGAMSDPQLTLFSGPLRIADNNNWGGTTELAVAFARAGAFNLGSASRDAALLTTLAPGDYTVQVSGSSGATGTTLVEIYEAP